MFGFIILVIFFIWLIFYIYQYVFGVSITALLTGPNQVEIDVNSKGGTGQPPPVPEIKWENQVFNIPGNVYTYENAKSLCAAYGSKLATVEEVESAYQDGAEWCNYGWSDNQLVLYPTQDKTYKKLQGIKGHENDCGRTGINGGYVSNPNLKYGVNCYGHKPKITYQEETLMQNMNQMPPNEEQAQFQQQVNYWKTQVGNILVSPYNYKLWSRI